MPLAINITYNHLLEVQFVAESSLANAQCISSHVTKAERGNMQQQGFEQ